MNSLYSFGFILGVFLLQGIFTLCFLSRQKARRQVRPPIDLKLRRLPGESLRIKSEALLEQMMNWLILGSVLAVALLITPFAVLQLLPKIEPIPAFVSSLALFAAGNKRIETKLGELCRDVEW